MCMENECQCAACCEVRDKRKEEGKTAGWKNARPKMSASINNVRRSDMRTCAYCNSAALYEFARLLAGFILRRIENEYR